MEAVLRRYKKVLIPELNAGQLRRVIRGELMMDTIGFSKIKGKPFLISEIEGRIMEVLSEGSGQ